MEVTVPDGVRWVLIICTPKGDDALVEARWDEEHLDAITALEVIELAKTDVARQAATHLQQSSRRRLMQPLAAPPRDRDEKAPVRPGREGRP